jgi:hypothetical protein
MPGLSGTPLSIDQDDGDVTGVQHHPGLLGVLAALQGRHRTRGL